MAKTQTLALFQEVELVAAAMSEAQFGQLMKAVFAYRFHGEDYTGDDQAVYIAFLLIANQVDRGQEAREEKVRAVNTRWEKHRAQQAAKDASREDIAGESVPDAHTLPEAASPVVATVEPVCHPSASREPVSTPQPAPQEASAPISEPLRPSETVGESRRLSPSVRGAQRRCAPPAGYPYGEPSAPSAPARAGSANGELSRPALDRWESGEGARQFNRFWSLYPKKSDRRQAELAWQEVNPGDWDALFDALSKWSASRQWQEEGGRYVPAAAKWLRGRRWLDAPSPCTVSSPIQPSGHLGQAELEAIQRVLNDPTLADDPEPQEAG